MRKICPNCKEGFSTESTQRKFCSKECAKKERRKQRNEYDKELRRISKEIGNCTSCYRPNDSVRYNTCSKCRQKSQIQSKKNRAKK